MDKTAPEREQLLAHLDGTVSQAALFFGGIDGGFFDGHQNARAVLSHLVFWHREYYSISQDLVEERELSLLKGSLAELNERAFCEFQTTSMPELAACLTEMQENLADNLRRLPSWDVNFPFKMGCRKIDVAGRIIAVERHIRHHLARQERARQRGEAWIRAYYR